MTSTKEVPRDGLVIIRKQIKIELQIKYRKKMCEWVESEGETKKAVAEWKL